MDYSTEPLPAHVFDGCDRGNFQTRNARFRAQVCKHLKLQWKGIAGDGNCFFEAVVALLRAADKCPLTFNAHELRLNIVQLFRTSRGSTQAFCERLIIDISAELNEKLVCSSHATINGRRINGFKPATVDEYLQACETDGVWTQGFHWLRAVSFLYDVRVAVVIFGQEIVRFFGQGDTTLYLYKVDAETHFDALAPLADGAPAASAGECSPPPPCFMQCTLTLYLQLMYPLHLLLTV